MKIYTASGFCLTVLLAACHVPVARQSTTAGTRDSITVVIVDTYRWHFYHLSKESPQSPDGLLSFVRVSKIGDAEVIDLQSGDHINVRSEISDKELNASRRPMKVVSFDFNSQTVDFKWLTTN